MLVIEDTMLLKVGILLSFIKRWWILFWMTGILLGNAVDPLEVYIVLLMGVYTAFNTGVVLLLRKHLWGTQVNVWPVQSDFTFWLVPACFSIHCTLCSLCGTLRYLVTVLGQVLQSLTLCTHNRVFMEYFCVVVLKR